MGFRCVKHRRVQDDPVRQGQLLAAMLRTDQRVGTAAGQDRDNAVQAEILGHQRVVQQRLHHRRRIGIGQRLDQDLVEVDFALGTTGVEPAQAAHQPGARDTAQTSNRMRHHLSGDTLDRCGGEFRSVDLVADHRPTVAVPFQQAFDGLGSGAPVNAAHDDDRRLFPGQFWDETQHRRFGSSGRFGLDDGSWIDHHPIAPRPQVLSTPASACQSGQMLYCNVWRSRQRQLVRRR